MTAPLWTFKELKAALKFSNDPVLEGISGISMDTQTLKPGDLFIALKGKKQDAHDFVAEALKKGAAGAVVSHPIAGIPNQNLLITGDTWQALNHLAQAARHRTSATVVGITGSAGKTTVKEALYHVFSRQSATVASPKSYNNASGVPFSLSYLQANTRFGVFEIGMNYPGEIIPLTTLVRPHIALITTVAPAHLGNFSGMDAIAQAKAEIFQGVVPGGCVLLNRDNLYFSFLKKRAIDEGIQHILSFGKDPQADVRLLTWEEGPDSSTVQADVAGTVVTYRMPLAGYHHVLNSLAILAVVKAAQADVKKAAADLAGVTPVEGRGVRHQIFVKGGQIEIIDESYNANPDSMRAALGVLEKIPAPRRRIAVLGDMLELGPTSPELHRQLKGALPPDKVHLVAACGGDMETLYHSLPKNQQGGYGKNSQELADLVTALVQPGDVVMIKGSLGSKMKTVLQALLALNEGKDDRKNIK